MRSVSVIACEYVLSSQDFSIPVCKYPRSGTAFTTVSPSSSSRILKTPCVDGCCGPMFRTIVFAGPIAVSTVVVLTGAVLTGGSSYIASRLLEYPGNPRPDNLSAMDNLPSHPAAECAVNPDAR